MHDIGKPFSYTEGDIRHFKNHATVSSNMAKAILKRLNFDESFINEIFFLIKCHDVPLNDKYIIDNKEIAYKRYKIQYCDALAHNPEKLEKRIKYLTHFKEILDNC